MGHKHYWRPISDVYIKRSKDLWPNPSTAIASLLYNTSTAKVPLVNSNSCGWIVLRCYSHLHSLDCRHSWGANTLRSMFHPVCMDTLGVLRLKHKDKPHVKGQGGHKHLHYLLPQRALLHWYSSAASARLMVLPWTITAVVPGLWDRNFSFFC